MVPYESGARRITSNLGSDLFCPLWLVGLAHLEWRARVARSCCIGRRWSVGCSPLVLDTYSAHVECGGKFSQVWPKLHLLSIWRWKRAPIARLVSLSVIWGGPPVFQVASSQTWGRARPRGETSAPGSAAPPLRSLSHGGFRSRLRPSSCGVEGGACILGPKEYEDAIRVKSAMNLAESPFILILDCTCSHRWRRPGEKRKRTEIFVSMLGDCFLAHLEHYAAVWDRLATLWENRPLNASTWGVAPRLSKTWSEKASGGAVAHQRALSAPVVARECALSPPLWSPLRSQPRCPRVVREDERVRISAPRPTWDRFPLVGLHRLHFHQ